MKPNTVIPAIRGYKELELPLESPQETLFLLEGELIQLQAIAETVRRTGKKPCAAAVSTSASALWSWRRP